MTMTIPARDVRVGDTVLDEHGAPDFRVHHAMTTGRLAKTTSIRAVNGDPRHYGASDLVSVERPEGER